ncbi:MAG: aspartate carbamoyltransferase, partial [Perlucidibaca sp.]
MSQAIRYTGVRVIDPASAVDQVRDVIIAEGQVLAAGADLPVAETRAGEGLWITPAFVDLCARLREPGPRLH